MKPCPLLLLGLFVGLGCKKWEIPAVGVKLEGRVLNQSNRPVAGLELILYENESTGGFFGKRAATYARQTTRSDEQGRFAFAFADRTYGCNALEYASHLSPNVSQLISRGDSLFRYEPAYPSGQQSPPRCRGFNAELTIYVLETHVKK